MRFRRLAPAALGLLLLLAPAAHAVEPDEVLTDARLEARAREISQELRCLVCQNQSIDDSAAPLARDLRLLVRERLTAGDSDRQVLDFVVARYGEFVLLRPPVNAHTLVLWLAPALLLLIAMAWAIAWIVRQRGRAPSAPAAPTLTAEEQARLDALLREPEGPSR
jgi:cytochrome c-type biogenesis protein CcmH